MYVQVCTIVTPVCAFCVACTLVSGTVRAFCVTCALVSGTIVTSVRVLCITCALVSGTNVTPVRVLCITSGTTVVPTCVYRCAPLSHLYVHFVLPAPWSQVRVFCVICVASGTTVTPVRVFCVTCALVPGTIVTPVRVLCVTCALVPGTIVTPVRVLCVTCALVSGTIVTPVRVFCVFTDRGRIEEMFSFECVILFHNGVVARSLNPIFCKLTFSQVQPKLNNETCDTPVLIVKGHRVSPGPIVLPYRCTLKQEVVLEWAAVLIAIEVTTQHCSHVGIVNNWSMRAIKP